MPENKVFVQIVCPVGYFFIVTARLALLYKKVHVVK